MTGRVTRDVTSYVATHGGDVWQVAEELGIPVSEVASGILDFSANINPRGLPPRALARLAKDAADSRLLGLYPDPSARSLRNALSEQLGVPGEAIVVGPGAEALLAPIVGRALGARRALVPVPAFSEYRRGCAQQGVEVVPFPLDRSERFRIPVERLCARIEKESCDAVFLNNPHNPSGAMLEAQEVRRALDATAAAGGTLILDEAFIDYAPRASLVREAAGRRGLIVVRSLTKFYGCPALRVGYAVAHPETIRRVVDALPTWGVTQLAMDALAEAVGDREYAEASVRENAVERERLAESLGGVGLVVFPSAANYLLVELGADMPAASELRARLIGKHRILIRNCDSYEGLETGRYVRVAVRSGDENARLVRALGEELQRILSRKEMST
jgi:threonine-phosphate decarboxylase